MFCELDFISEKDFDFQFGKAIKEIGNQFTCVHDLLRDVHLRFDASVCVDDAVN